MNEQDQLNEKVISALVIGKEIKPSPRHPHAEELLSELNAVLKKWDVTVTDYTDDIADFTLYNYAGFKNLKLMLLGMVSLLFAFVIDDHMDEHPEEIETWMNNFRQKVCTGNRAIDKLFRIIVEMCNDREAVSEYASGKVMQTFVIWIQNMFDYRRFMSGKQLPTDEEHVQLRIDDSGSQGVLNFIQIESGLEILPKGLDTDPNWLNLNREFSKHFGQSNDLMSFKKEFKQGKFKSNYVYVKMKNHNISAQEAVNAIVDEVNECKKMVDFYGNCLKSWNNKSIDRYVENCKLYLTGNDYWSSICNRYNKDLYTFNN